MRRKQFAKAYAAMDVIAYYVDRISKYQDTLNLNSDESGLNAALEERDERKLKARLMYLNNELAKRVDKLAGGEE